MVSKNILKEVQPWPNILFNLSFWWIFQRKCLLTEPACRVDMGGRSWPCRATDITLWVDSWQPQTALLARRTALYSVTARPLLLWRRHNILTKTARLTWQTYKNGPIIWQYQRKTIVFFWFWTTQLHTAQFPQKMNSTHGSASDPRRPWAGRCTWCACGGRWRWIL